MRGHKKKGGKDARTEYTLPETASSAMGDCVPEVWEMNTSGRILFGLLCIFFCVGSLAIYICADILAFVLFLPAKLHNGCVILCELSCDALVDWSEALKELY